MHSLYPAIARIWQTAKPCFVPGSLCECQSCSWEAFSCAPSLSQKLCIIVNGAYTGIQVPFQALQRLLCTCWHSEAELCIETALLTSCLWWCPFQTVETKHNAGVHFCLTCGLFPWKTILWYLCVVVHWKRHSITFLYSCCMFCADVLVEDTPTSQCQQTQTCEVIHKLRAFLIG